MQSAFPVRSPRLLLWVVLLTFSLGSIWTSKTQAQGAADNFGNGGRHSIHGRLYVTNGRRSDVSGLKIRLTSSSAGDISIFTDDSGAFTFRNLNAGSYSVVVEGGGVFEDARESVYIDDPGSASIRSPIRMRAAPRTMSVQFYLRPAAAAKSGMAPGILNAKWANVPKAAIGHYENGLKLVRGGNDRGASSEFGLAVEIWPAFAPAHTEIGRIAQRAGNLVASIKAWTTAIRYDKSDFEAHLNLGIAYLNLKKYVEAENALVNAAHLDPTAITPHYYLGMLFVLKNDLNIAQKAFETARELKGGKSLPNIHKYLGRIYKKKDMEKEAIRELETYLKLAPAAEDAEKVRKDISELKAKTIKNAFV